MTEKIELGDGVYAQQADTDIEIYSNGLGQFESVFLNLSQIRKLVELANRVYCVNFVDTYGEEDKR